MVKHLGNSFINKNNDGYIYSFCIEKYCYYGFTNNLERRESQHRNKLSLIWNDINNEQYEDFLSFLEGNKVKYDFRYYKMISVLISINKKDTDFIFKEITKSEIMSGGGLIEKYFAANGIFNGKDKNINLNNKKSFFDLYKSREEIYNDLKKWIEVKNG